MACWVISGCLTFHGVLHKAVADAKVSASLPKEPSKWILASLSNALAEGHGSASQGIQQT